MKKKLVLSAFSALMILVISCEEKSLDEQKIKDILTEAKAYPSVVDYRVFCNQTETAKRIIETNLDELGLVKVQSQHTLDDVGTPLVQFTEQANPYLLTTSDTARSLDVQIVKLADENFHHVKEITVSPDGNHAMATFTTTLSNQTPFTVLLEQAPDSVQLRRASFTQKNGAWSWDGKIVKVKNEAK